MAVTITRTDGTDEQQAFAAIGSAGFAVEAKDSGPGKTEPHQHGYDVCLHILRGELKLNLPQETVARSCRPGDRVFVPAGTPHAEEHGDLRMVVGRRAPQPAQSSGDDA